jgi:integrase
VAFILFALLGRRNGEICKARKSWLRRNGTGWMLDVIDRPEEDFFCKHGTERNLPVAPEIVGLLEQHYKHSPDGDFLVSASSKTARFLIIYEQHGAWAANWIKDYTKVSYELRRYAGSLVLKKTGSMKAVQRFLSHSSIGTTEKTTLICSRKLPALSFFLLFFDFPEVNMKSIKIVKTGAVAKKAHKGLRSALLGIWRSGGMRLS